MNIFLNFQVINIPRKTIFSFRFRVLFLPHVSSYFVKFFKQFQTQQPPRNEIPERENEQRGGSVSDETKITSRSLGCNLPNTLTRNGNCSPSVDNSTGSVMEETYDDYDTGRRDDEKTSVTTARERDENRKKKFDNESRIIDERGRVMCIESHSNGSFYEEYILKMSIGGEIKLKCPVLLNNNDVAVKMEFVDDEVEYERAPLDRIMIFFKNIYASVNVKQSGVSCGTQTIKLKTSNNFAQTTLTGLHSFSRLNVGARVSKQISKFLFRSSAYSKTRLFVTNEVTEYYIGLRRESKNRIEEYCKIIAKLFSSLRLTIKRTIKFIVHRNFRVSIVFT